MMSNEPRFPDSLRWDASLTESSLFLRILIIELSASCGIRFDSFRHTLDLELAMEGSQDKSDPLPCTPVYGNTVLLEHSHAHLPVDYLWLLSLYNSRVGSYARDIMACKV